MRSTLPDDLAALQAKDPNFNQQIFLDRAQAAFFALQKAWVDRNLEPARVYMSDGIYHRWKNQIDAMIAAHKRNLLDNLVIGGVHIVKVHTDPNFDTVTVRIDASAADYEVDDTTSNKVIYGSRQNQPFSEYWTFIRSGSARTKSGEGAEVTQCPNRGAPLSINESGVCSCCKATVTSGQFGWVLDNITQASEWQGSTNKTRRPRRTCRRRAHPTVPAGRSRRRPSRQALRVRLSSAQLRHPVRRCRLAPGHRSSRVRRCRCRRPSRTRPST